MRDPELMQRADRAAIALEEAWERWRGMHGLGTEPLPPVSSYVGYSLEEPWGQPRVVFGLRADEAELLASLLDGHDCVGPIYADVSTRPGWRRPVNAAASELNRPYANSVSVPEQAPPSPLDQLGRGGRVPDEDAADSAPEPDPADDGLVDDGSDGDAVDGESPAPRDKAGRFIARGEGGDTAAGDASLAPLPEPASLDGRQEKATKGAQGKAGSAKRSTRRGPGASQGPGYRGPRYQGFPPRYDSGGAAKAAEQGDGDEGEPDAEPAGPRRSHVAKLNRTTRRRASSG